MTSVMVALAAVIALAVVVLATLRTAMRAVGEVASEFGEDPVHWQRMMLPFGILGPFVARLLLLHRRGGPRGPAGYA